MKISIEDSNILHTAPDIYRYIHGGQGVVTLMAPFGVHHSYIFKKPADRDAFPDDVIFVYALHDNGDGSFKQFYVGMMEDDQFRLTAHSRFNPETDIAKGAKYIVRMANDAILTMKTPMVLYHNGTCGVCGRPLSSCKALETGIGKKCMKYVESR